MRTDMIERVASRKIASMEKQAILRQMRQLVRPFSDILRYVKGYFVGATEEDIQKAMKKLKRDKAFKKIVEEAPKKVGLKKLWGYYSFTIKRVLRITGKFLAIAVLVALFASKVGPLFLKLGISETTTMLMGFLLASGVTVEDADSHEKQKERAMEIAKGRLLNR